MNLILTRHAKKRMAERNISLEKIRQAIELPDYTITKDGLIETYKNIQDKILKVIYQPEGKFIKIITLMWK